VTGELILPVRSLNPLYYKISKVCN